MSARSGEDGIASVDLNAAPWVDRGRARLKELSAHGKRLRLVEFLPGFSDPDWCAKGHVVYVLEGVIESEYADHVTTRPAGEAYVLPPGVKHRSRNPFAAPARLLIVDDAGSVSGRPAAPAGG